MAKRFGIIAVILTTIFTWIVQIWGVNYCNYSSFTIIFSTGVYLAVFSFLFIDAYYTIAKWKNLYYLYSLIRDVCWLVSAVAFFYLIGNYVDMEFRNIIILVVLVIVPVQVSFILTKLSGRYVE